MTKKLFPALCLAVLLSGGIDARQLTTVSWITSTALNAEARYNGAHYVFIDVDLTAGPYPSVLRLYVDDVFVVEHRIPQTPKGQSQTMLWAPTANQSGVHMLRIDAVTALGVFTDRKPVSVW